MAKPKALIVFAPGTNCDEETTYCLEQAGAVADRVLISDLFESRAKYGDYQILALPGGFSYGDCIAAGRILANYLATQLKDLVQEFVRQDKLIIGICNGFQTLAHLGFFNGAEGKVTLERNESLKFECRWVRLRVPDNADSIFVRGITEMWLPVAHAEGRLVTENRQVLDRLLTSGQVALQYAAHSGPGEPTYPENPNGSHGHVAGLVDSSMRVFGLMPHPERYFSSRLRFALKESKPPSAGEETLGLRIFQNAVSYFS